MTTLNLPINNLPIFKRRTKPISWSDFFEIKSDELVYLQIQPDTSVTNGVKVDTITKSLHSIYKHINDRIERNGFKITYHKKDIISYAVVFNKGEITFHFAVPKKWQNFITQRIYSVWGKATIIATDNDYLKIFNKKKCIEHQVGLKNKYFTSISADYRENVFVPALLSTIKDMNKKDKAMLEIILNPVDASWKVKAIQQLKDFKKGNITESNLKSINSSDIVDIIIDKSIKFFEGLFGAFDGFFELDIKGEKDVEKLDFGLNKMTSPASRSKTRYNGFEAHIRIISQSDDEIRRGQIAEVMSIALNDLAEDNEFQVIKKIDHNQKYQKEKKKIKNKVNIFYKTPEKKRKELKKLRNFDRKMPSSAKNNILNTKEVGQLVQMPTAKWQKEYPEIQNVDVFETQVPKECLGRGIPIGYIKYKGVEKVVNWNSFHPDGVGYNPLAVFAPQGYGKTTFLINYGVYSIELGRSLFVFDGIQGCEMSQTIRDRLPENFPEEKIIDLNFGNPDRKIPLLWNEIKITDDMKPSEKMYLANQITNKLMAFLDSLVDQNEHKLSPKMRRYLSSAGLLVFSMPDTTIMDVLNVLVDFNTRHEFIDKSKLSPSNKIVRDLLNLDLNGGTKENEIKGIIDRMDLIIGDFVLNNLFSAKSQNNLDFAKWANEGYAVFCRMPQDELDDHTINILTTFLVSKLWLASLSNRPLDYSDKLYTGCSVIIDEIHRVPLALRILDNLREMRKRKLQYVFSAHQPSDFWRLLPTLQSAGSSYVLYSTTRENLRHFEQELKPFTVEDCMHTKKHHAKIICNYDKQYTTFDAQLLLPVEKTKKFIDRSHISSKCQEKYGVEIEL